MNRHIFKSATELAQQIRNGETSSTEILQDHLAQISKHNPKLNAVVISLEEECLKEAAKCDKEAIEGKFRGPLHGVPFTVKEQFWVKGTKSTLNTKRLKDWTAEEDALIVKRLKEAGAVLVGKTNVAKDLMDYQINGDIYPECRNPYNSEYSPGGSSGGSAAALASGMVPIELGGDFGGSIRVPSNFCGVFGLKTTHNSIPGHGSTPKPKGDKGFLFDMAVSGPMARTAEDLALVWDVISKPDNNDTTIPPIAWKDSGNKKLAEFKIGWVHDWPKYKTSQQTKDVIQNFINLIEKLGCRNEMLSSENDLHERSIAVFKKLSFQMILQDVPMLIKPLMVRSLKSGFLKGLKNVEWKFKDSFRDYSELKGIQAGITKEWEDYFEKYDFLVCPSGFGPAYKPRTMGTPINFEGQEITYINYVWPFNCCFNASGHPVIHIPLGLGKEGLPVGVLLVGPLWGEPALLHFTKLVSEHIQGFVKPEHY